MMDADQTLNILLKSAFLCLCLSVVLLQLLFQYCGDLLTMVVKPLKNLDNPSAGTPATNVMQIREY